MIVKLDPWVQEILRDPLSKTKLVRESDTLISDYGRRYPIVDGVYDLRLLTQSPGQGAKRWRRGQTDYERWSARAATKNRGEDYAGQRQGVAEVYRAIPILGRCLDVGGNDGRLRAFLDPAQEYVSIDPYLGITTETRRETYRTVYPFADVPMNFVGALAEYLPFAAMSFETVHMRSVVDHFANPELAMREAFRVLKGNGVLVVGLYVKGGERGRESVRAHLKELVRSGLVAFGATRVEDHHVWHPSYEELCNLVCESGFVLNRTHWQKSEDRRVCYLKAIKPGAVKVPRAGVNGGMASVEREDAKVA